MNALDEINETQIQKVSMSFLETRYSLAHKMAFSRPLTGVICKKRDKIMSECQKEFRRRGEKVPPCTS